MARGNEELQKTAKIVGDSKGILNSIVQRLFIIYLSLSVFSTSTNLSQQKK